MAALSSPQDENENLLETLLLCGAQTMEMETHQLLHLASRRVELMKAAAVHIGVTSRTNDQFMHPITVRNQCDAGSVWSFASSCPVPLCTLSIIIQCGKMHEVLLHTMSAKCAPSDASSGDMRASQSTFVRISSVSVLLLSLRN